MKRRWGFLPAVCVLLLALTGCSFPFSFYTLMGKTVDGTKYREAFANNWQYRSLSEPMKENYGVMYTTVADGSNTDETVTFTDSNGNPMSCAGLTVVVPNPMKSKEEIATLYTAFFNDNPRFFYFSNQYGIEGVTGIDGTPAYNKIHLCYVMDSESRQTASRRLEERVKSVIRDMPQGEDDFQKERYLHDTLLNQCAYDSSNVGDASSMIYSAYGALVNGVAVCEGYSRGLQCLCHEAGLDATLVSGQSLADGGEHMWNLIRVNGENYHVDATWDDNANTPHYRYFNLTTDRILLSHRLTPGQPWAETCTATKDNYYVREGTFVNAQNRDGLASVIATQWQNGAKEITLCTTADEYDGTLMYLKNQKRVRQDTATVSGVTLPRYTLLTEAGEYIILVRF